MNQCLAPIIETLTGKLESLYPFVDRSKLDDNEKNEMRVGIGEKIELAKSFDPSAGSWSGSERVILALVSQIETVCAKTDASLEYLSGLPAGPHLEDADGGDSGSCNIADFIQDTVWAEMNNLPYFNFEAFTSTVNRFCADAADLAILNRLAAIIQESKGDRIQPDSSLNTWDAMLWWMVENRKLDDLMAFSLVRALEACIQLMSDSGYRPWLLQDCFLSTASIYKAMLLTIGENGRSQSKTGRPLSGDEIEIMRLFRAGLAVAMITRLTFAFSSIPIRSPA